MYYYFSLFQNVSVTYFIFCSNLNANPARLCLGLVSERVFYNILLTFFAFTYMAEQYQIYMPRK